MNELKLYLVYFESANYAGYGEHILVEAESEDAAREAVDPYANEFYYAEDAQQLEEEEIDCEGFYATIVSVEEFNESHESWEYRDTYTRL